MLLKKSYDVLHKLSLAVVCLFLAFGCSDGGDNDGGAGNGSAQLRNEVVNCEEVRNTLYLKGTPGVKYTMEITSGENWTSFTPKLGTLVKEGSIQSQEEQSVFIYFSRNTATKEREATIEVKFSNGGNTVLKFTQEAYANSAKYDRKWGEQPYYRENKNFIYKTYFTKLNQEGNKNKQYTARNYSICFDKERHLSHWVAYPLHNVYTQDKWGRGEDVWNFDDSANPKIDRQYQQNITQRGYGRGYHRGHQLPNASRYNNKATNQMTFLTTNCFPQDGNFNSHEWADLEMWVRQKVRPDTLYVVTGIYFGNSSNTITDNDGKRITVPTNSWKVLLRTRRGYTGKAISECKADELIGIGFWYNNGSNDKDLKNHVVSIADVEAKTGFRFFRNLPPEAAEAVKNQKDYSAWNN